MFRIFTFFPLFIALVLPISSETSLAQDSDESAYEEPKRRKKSRRKKVQRQVGPSPWFPEWSLTKRSWSFRPIMSYRKRKTEAQGVTTDTYAYELGAELTLPDYVLVPNNSPGLMLRPFGGYTWGYQAAKVRGEALSIDSDSSYNRAWYGLEFTFYYQYYKHILKITQGKIGYDKDFSDIQLLEVVNNFGLKLLSHLSLHLSVTKQWVYLDQFSDTIQDSLDNWLYIQSGFQLFDTIVQFGPGIANRKTYSYEGDQRLSGADGTQTYLLARAGMNIFWKLGLEIESQYIFDADQSGGENTIYNQLPNQDLSSPPPPATLPADSLNTYLFFGFRNLFGGFGFGYQYNSLTINYSSNDNRQTYKDQGYTVVYSMSY